MYNFKLLIFLFTFLALTQSKSIQQETVKVSLYYESLCPYSIEFVVSHLYPGYLQLGDALVVDLVPYGNAYRSQVDGKWQFDCQHGPEECLGNKIQACVIANQSLTQEQKVKFVGCIMGSSDPASVQNGENCATTNDLSWADINECVEGSEGDDLLAHFGEVTDSLVPPHEYVPNIRFNDVFNETLENDARTDFVVTACELFKVKPVTCHC